MNKFLGFLAAVIVIGGIVGTAVALISKHAVPGEGLERRTAADGAERYGKDAAMLSMGTLRIRTQVDTDKRTSLLVVTPWIVYKGGDTAFFEELDRRYQDIKAIFERYFAARTESGLTEQGEEAIKAELVALVNEILVLGKIQGVYFSDFQFIKS